ncbi:hypothetical protein AGMMS49938_17330 [Fibrobacterales bacterium]|nr:hypothetical protein AGMMS49938_17330 [Fibrobacterales bacterium]
MSSSSSSESGNSLVKDGHLGYGYDVIKSSYINRDGVKVGYPILDIKKFIDSNLVAEIATSKTEFQTWTGSSISEFYKKRNAGISAEYGSIFFSGKFASEFKSNESISESSKFLKGRFQHYVGESYIKSAAPANLKKYLSNDFIESIANESASWILDHYGSHLLVRYYSGGAAEFNYIYSGKVLKTDSELNSALDANFKSFKAGATYNKSDNSQELYENSQFDYKTYGGNTTSYFDIDEFVKGYNAWSNSIDSNPDISGIGEFEQSLIPIWELVSDANKASALKKEFNDRAIKQGKLLLVKKAKTLTKEYNTPGDFSFNFSDGFPAQIEIYALGGGGGGQGGGRDEDVLFDNYSRGAGGSGSGAAYLQLTAEKEFSLNITVGAGGNGGDYYKTSTNYQWGFAGVDGGTTVVEWADQGIRLNANGGLGGKNGTAGAGGFASTTPTTHDLYKVYPIFTQGTAGLAGNQNTAADSGSNGGKSAVIDTNLAGYKGSLSSFGGYVGATKKDAQVTAAGYGGGGAAGWDLQNGTNGGNGLVNIKITYWVEE